MVPPPPLPQTSEPKPVRSPGGMILVGLIIAGWVLVLSVILRSPI